MQRTGRLIGMVATAGAVLAALGVVGFLVVAPRVVGGAALTVLSGSMSPTIPVGSVVLIKPVDDLLGLEPGAVITYQTSPTERSLTTHRIVRFQPETEPPTYITKGDANRGEDIDPVPVGAIRGEVIAHVPYLGRLSAYLGGPRGPFLLMVIVAVGVIVTQGRKLVAALRDQDPDDEPGPPPPPEPPLEPTATVGSDTAERSRT